MLEMIESAAILKFLIAERTFPVFLLIVPVPNSKMTELLFNIRYITVNIIIKYIKHCC